MSGRDAALQRLSAQVTQLADMLSMAQSGNTDLKSQLATISQQLAAANQALAAAQAQAGQSQQRADAAEQQASAQQTTIDQLNQNIAALRDQLQQLAAALDASDAKNKDQAAQITDLGQRLNLALLSQVQPSRNMAAGIFRAVARRARRPADIRIVGDRFVFQSEVLFPPAPPC